MAETTCPVFRPTEQEFKSFRRYMEDVVDPIAGKVGLCKVIPPPGWAARRRDAAEELCKAVYIPAPIRQCVSSTRSNGVYSVDVVENPPMSLAEFKEYADKRVPFPSSTASAGFLGSAAVGVRRGRSGRPSPCAADVGDPDGEGVGGGGGGGGACGYGGGYGFSCGGGSGSQPGSVGAEESEVARRVRMFWRSLGPNSEAPVYGADTLGTLFAEDDDDAWNVGRLDTILQLLKANLPGITSTMLYAGMWRSMFAFHVEDVNLYSINYLHRGDPKSWYGIPPDSRQRFESLAQAFFTEEFHRCKDHLRHKTSMISPLQIQKAGIGYCTAVQEAGEFMITFPGAYHGGFNHGFNLAESTNFAIDRWIREGRGAGYCRCSPHSVRIDVDRFETLVRQHRRIAGRDSTCLDGLAEPVAAAAALGPGSTARRKDSSGDPADSQQAAKKASRGGVSRRAGREDDVDDSDKEGEGGRGQDVDEDIQVFHCVCNNIRCLRRVRWTKDGGFVAVPSGKAPSSSSAASPAWPDEESVTECPRCGVWGHKACLEYVVPPQFAIREAGSGYYTTATECGQAAECGNSGPDAAADCDERGGGRTRAPGEALDQCAGADKKDAANGTGCDAGVAADPAPAAATASDANTAALLAALPPKPVCWMCMQEKAEVASMSAAAGTASGGGAAAAAPRRAGKASGGGKSRIGGGGGSGSRCSNSSGGVCSAGQSPARDISGNDSGKKKEPKNKITGKGEQSTAGKRARTCDSGGHIGGAASSPATEASAGARAALTTTAVRMAAADSAGPGVSKRARVGPRLLGKEVLVSDGLAAVLTGVVTAIEAGQARIHYKGRKAKLDEWIDVRSERFLSAGEAKRQIALARLAANPAAAKVSDSPGGLAGKKRKTPGGSSATTGGGPGGKRAKKGGDGGGVGKLKSGKSGDKKLGDRKAGKATEDGKSPTEAKSKRLDGSGTSPAAGNRRKVGETAADSSKEGHRSGEKVANGGRGPADKEKTCSPTGKGKTAAYKRSGGTETAKKSGQGGNKRGKPENRSSGSSQLKSGGGSSREEGGGNKPCKDEALGSGSSAERGSSSSGGGSAAKTKPKNGKKATKKPRVMPAVIPPPVVVRREVPEHHVISNRRAVVLARTFAKEAEEAQKDFEEAVAAAERSRIAREQRLKASCSPRSVPPPPPSQGAVSAVTPAAAAVKPLGGGDGSIGGPNSAAVSAGPRRRWPDLGFPGQPWGLGPFCRQATIEGEEQEDFDEQGQEDAMQVEEARGGEEGAMTLPVGADSAAAAAAVAVARSAIPAKPPRAQKEMRRARVGAGETVDLGDSVAFRKWLTGLRAIKGIPVGHVEKCSRSLAVLLGMSPPDGSVRASLRALIIAESLRGGASHEVATFVRSLASLMAEAASKAWPSQAAAAAAASTPPAGNPVAASEGESESSVHPPPTESQDGVGMPVGMTAADQGCWSDGEVYEDPAELSVRDIEGAASYANALAHLARSRRKQDRAATLSIRDKAEADAAVTAAAEALGKARGRKKGKQTKKAAWAMRRHLEAVEMAQADVLPSSRVPPPAVVGSIPGAYPFSRSGDALLMHAKAMVGLKRSHRWATAWLNAPSRSEQGTTDSLEIAKPTSAFAPAIEQAEPVAHSSPPMAVSAAERAAPATHDAPLTAEATAPASAAPASRLVAAAATAAAAAASARHASYGAEAVIGWQHAFPPPLPPHASLAAAVLSSAPTTAGYYPASSAAATAAGFGALPPVHPRPYIHGTYGGLHTDSAGTYRNALHSYWPPATASVAATGGVGWSTPSSTLAAMMAPAAPAASTAPGAPVDLLERWERIGAVAPVLVQHRANDEEEVRID